MILLLFEFQSVQKEFQDVSRELESERYRAERLEEQVNDLTELHQVKLTKLFFFKYFFSWFFSSFIESNCIPTISEIYYTNVAKARACMK